MEADAGGGGEFGEEGFARAAFAVGAGPHVPPGRGGDDEFVAVAGEVHAEETAEAFLGGAGGRP